MATTPPRSAVKHAEETAREPGRTASQLLRSANKEGKGRAEEASSKLRAVDTRSAKRNHLDWDAGASGAASEGRRPNKVARRASRGAPALEGALSELPAEILDVVALNLAPDDLARLACTCRYFATSSLVERTARKLLTRHRNPRAALLQPVRGETWLRLLRFNAARDTAAVAARSISLGSYHTLAVLSGPLPTAPSDAVVVDVDTDGDEVEEESIHEGAANTARDPASVAADETALCAFGRGFHGQLGRGGYGAAFLPVPIALSVPSAALIADDSGDDDAATAASKSQSPVAKPLPSSGNVSSALSVVCGASHSSCVLPNGNMYTWGLASSGELGHGGWTPIELAIPRRVCSVGSLRITLVAAGSNHTLAVANDGSLWSCGRGRHGQLGHGHFHDAGPLQRVEGLAHRTVCSAAAGNAHTLALCDDGSVYSWGDNRHGQIGQCDNEGNPLVNTVFAWPTRVDALDREHVASLACGAHHSMALTHAGKLLAFGRGRHGALGLGTESNAHLPRVVPLLAQEERASEENKNRILALASAHRAGSRRRSAGAAQCSSATLARSTNSPAPARCVHVACGGAHTVALIARGLGALEVRACGLNAYGQLGVGDNVNRNVLTRVPGLASPVAVAAGEGHTAAVAADGALFTWGRGDWGQLGLGDQRSRNRAQRVASVWVGSEASVAVRQ